jgi:hypothetical protein
MPQQEKYLELEFDGGHLEVLKSYDPRFARDAFELMDDAARQFLSRSLDLQSKYDPTDIPSTDDPDALWQEIEEGARESWDTFSYFIVCEHRGERSIPKFVSSDWPTAEAFAKSHLP